VLVLKMPMRSSGVFRSSSWQEARCSLRENTEQVASILVESRVSHQLLQQTKRVSASTIIQ
jgi:hypothetical protein